MTRKRPTCAWRRIRNPQPSSDRKPDTAGASIARDEDSAGDANAARKEPTFADLTAAYIERHTRPNSGADGGTITLDDAIRPNMCVASVIL
jgi:hypothetical protein